MSVESSTREPIKISGPELLRGVETVLFDVDGILFNTHKIAVLKLKELLRRELGDGVDLNFEASQISRYGQLTEWALERGLSQEKAEGLEYTLWDSLTVLGANEEIDGASGLVKWLIEETPKKVGAHTSRPPEAVDATREFLRKIGNGANIPLSIRSSAEEDRHMFKAINAAATAVNFGPVLVLEDMPSHALNILNYADRYTLNVWALLVPYGLTSVPPKVLIHPRLICVERRLDNQGIGRVHSYLKGEPI